VKLAYDVYESKEVKNFSTVKYVCKLCVSKYGVLFLNTNLVITKKKSYELIIAVCWDVMPCSSVATF
jgi:hypothetical protein